MQPYGERNFELTGEVRLRATFEKVGFFECKPVYVLQVRERYESYPIIDDSVEGEVCNRWRDVKDTDLSIPGLEIYLRGVD